MHAARVLLIPFPSQQGRRRVVEAEAKARMGRGGDGRGWGLGEGSVKVGWLGRRGRLGEGRRAQVGEGEEGRSWQAGRVLGAAGGVKDPPMCRAHPPPKCVRHRHCLSRMNRTEWLNTTNKCKAAPGMKCSKCRQLLAFSCCVVAVR